MTDTALIHQQNPGALRDLRTQMMGAPSDVIRGGIAEYVERRNTFREGLRAQLREGLHYGYPPGCEPHIRESDGWAGVRSKGEVRYYPPEQWTAKPSLYKAGADLVIDFLELVAVYDADIDAWKQLGEPKGTFVFRCRLYPKRAAQVPENMVGEGRGVRKNGQKGGDENNAIKMAQKSARVDAVLNSFGLADLFTQDLEDSQHVPEVHENPVQSAVAHVVQPRGERVTAENLKSLFMAWVAVRKTRREPAELGDFYQFASDVTALPLRDVQAAPKWNRADFDKCYQWIVDNGGVE